ncbi:hypothetical protein BDF21DRAFT_432772 [Thamnidium elegans]|nr:hypothetical protein BDF21DRAFT_432772 [Thamnidium elegans]
MVRDVNICNQILICQVKTLGVYYAIDKILLIDLFFFGTLTHIIIKGATTCFFKKNSMGHYFELAQKEFCQIEKLCGVGVLSNIVPTYYERKVADQKKMT